MPKAPGFFIEWLPALAEQSYKGKSRIPRRKTSPQGDLAEHIGVFRQTINAIETGKFVPSTILALKLSKYFDVKVEEVFILEDND